MAKIIIKILLHCIFHHSTRRDVLLNHHSISATVCWYFTRAGVMSNVNAIAKLTADIRARYLNPLIIRLNWFAHQAINFQNSPDSSLWREVSVLILNAWGIRTFYRKNLKLRMTKAAQTAADKLTDPVFHLNKFSRIPFLRLICETNEKELLNYSSDGFGWFIWWEEPQGAWYSFAFLHNREVIFTLSLLWTSWGILPGTVWCSIPLFKAWR